MSDAAKLSTPYLLAVEACSECGSVLLCSRFEDEPEREKISRGE